MYCEDDIDRLSKQHCVPWNIPKSSTFGFNRLYIGFAWDLPTRTVALPPEKCRKYIQAVQEFQGHSMHTQMAVQQLYGKLLHASCILPYGRAYLVGLESMLGLYHGVPHRPIHAPKGTYDDLHLWT